MKDLHIGHGFRLPLDAATQTFLILGKRGSGKSSTATRFAEQLIDARIPIAVLDMVDVWWGLKAGADGERAGGKEIYIFGGRHGDLPLEPTAGELMADILVDQRINAVMVLREFSNREKAQFASGFADRLYRRNTEVLHLFAEEAHELIPQQPYGGEEEMVGRMNRLQKLGRTSGIGFTAITQRAASLNKNITTQSEILIAHRLIGPQDVRAVEDWIKHHHQEALKQQVLSTLPELKTGEAWVWAPDFPEDDPIGLQRLRILMPETFDSRRTPKPGEKRTEPKQLAPVDLERLGEKMAATRERAKQTDPKLLRQEVARLRAELAKKPKRVAPAATSTAEVKIVEVAAIKAAQVKRLESAAAAMERGADTIARALDRQTQELGSRVDDFRRTAREVVHSLQETTAQLRADGTRAKDLAANVTRPPVTVPMPVPSRARPPAPAGDSQLPPQARAMLQEAARRYPVRLTESQLATLSGYSTSSSQWKPSLRILAEQQLLVNDGGELVITEVGIQEADVESQGLPATPNKWIPLLPKQPGEFLRAIADAGSRGLTLAELAERTGYRTTSSQFKPSLATLRRNGLIMQQGDEVRLSDELFGAGVR